MFVCAGQACSEPDPLIDPVADADVEPGSDVVADANTVPDVPPIPDEDTSPSDDATGHPDATPVDADDVGDSDSGTELCQSACGCPQGEACTNGTCVLGTEPVFCCDQGGCPAGALCTSIEGKSSLCGATPSPAAGSLIINEILIDGAVSGDPNGDSDPSDPVGDEFVEIVNAGTTDIVLDGFTLEETTFVGLPRHTFEPGTTIGPGNAIVIFGGGNSPDDIPGTHFEIANAADVGISFGLSLDDDGDTLILLDTSGNLVAVVAWGKGAPLQALSDQSYTRSPDVTGEFTPHTSAEPNVFYSPGTKNNGSFF
jgi:hypothetical protein